MYIVVEIILYLHKKFIGNNLFDSFNFVFYPIFVLFLNLKVFFDSKWSVERRYEKEGNL